MFSLFPATCAFCGKEEKLIRISNLSNLLDGIKHSFFGQSQVSIELSSSVTNHGICPICTYKLIKSHEFAQIMRKERQNDLKNVCNLCMERSQELLPFRNGPNNLKRNFETCLQTLTMEQFSVKNVCLSCNYLLVLWIECKNLIDEKQLYVKKTCGGIWPQIKTLKPACEYPKYLRKFNGLNKDPALFNLIPYVYIKPDKRTTPTSTPRTSTTRTSTRLRKSNSSKWKVNLSLIRSVRVELDPIVITLSDSDSESDLTCEVCGRKEFSVLWEYKQHVFQHQNPKQPYVNMTRFSSKKPAAEINKIWNKKEINNICEKYIGVTVFNSPPQNNEIAQMVNGHDSPGEVCEDDRNEINEETNTNTDKEKDRDGEGKEDNEGKEENKDKEESEDKGTKDDIQPGESPKDNEETIEIIVESFTSKSPEDIEEDTDTHRTDSFIKEVAGDEIITNENAPSDSKQEEPSETTHVSSPTTQPQVDDLANEETIKTLIDFQQEQPSPPNDANEENAEEPIQNVSLEPTVEEIEQQQRIFDENRKNTNEQNGVEETSQEKASDDENENREDDERDSSFSLKLSPPFINAGGNGKTEQPSKPAADQNEKENDLAALENFLQNSSSPDRNAEKHRNSNMFDTQQLLDELGSESNEEANEVTMENKSTSSQVGKISALKRRSSTWTDPDSTPSKQVRFAMEDETFLVANNESSSDSEESTPGDGLDRLKQAVSELF